MNLSPLAPLRNAALVASLAVAACSSGSSSTSELGADASTQAPVRDGAIPESPAADSDAGAGPGTDATAALPACTTTLQSRVSIHEIDLATPYAYNEVDSNGPGLGLTPLAIAPLPGGGARVAFLGKGDSLVHVATLDASDQLVAGSLFTVPAYDFQDLYADAAGGVLLVSRPALGATDANHCGTLDNLCGLTANYPTAASCYDMYLVRFDGAKETWATKLTDTAAGKPAYATSATATGNTIFIWSQYAHNGRIASDGQNYAAYFGAAITVPGQACVGASRLASGVNIHQGDRMKVVSAAGALQTTGFDWGCSHSGYERVTWDPGTSHFVAVCKNDAPTGGKSGRLALAGKNTTIEPIDLSYANLGSVVTAGGGGYWVATSDLRAGQPANAAGLADVHLLHLPSTGSPTPDHDVLVPSSPQNQRAPHLAPYGTGQLLAAWEESTKTGDLAASDSGRTLHLQLRDRVTGALPAGSTADTAGPITVPVLGSRYQDFRAFPDGSVAYVAPGSTSTTIKVLRVGGCW